jgi:hypothetical protein
MILVYFAKKNNGKWDLLKKTWDARSTKFLDDIELEVDNYWKI